MIYEYKIKIVCESDMIVISPKIIASTIEKVRNADSKEIKIPVEELFPQEYVKYLVCVLRANMQLEPQKISLLEIYGLLAEQIEALQINHQKCFDNVCLCRYQFNIQLDLSVSEMFYMLIKEKMSKFLYIYKDLEGNEIKTAVTNTGNI